MDKTIIFIIIGVIILGAVFWAWQAGLFSGASVEPIQIPEGIILFYGEGCPHCKTVDDFVSQNNIEEKVNFSRLEVWYNKDNQNILAQVIQKCGVEANEVGVPFLYDGEKCLMGDVDVIDFFKQKAGL
ncbi:MAG: hypothetical protein ABIJ84_00205 [bacterium]